MPRQLEEDEVLITPELTRAAIAWPPVTETRPGKE